MGNIDEVFSLWCRRTTPFVGGVIEGGLDRWMKTSGMCGMCGMCLNIRVSQPVDKKVTQQLTKRPTSLFT